jgi:hypothetical protein
MKVRLQREPNSPFLPSYRRSNFILPPPRAAFALEPVSKEKNSERTFALFDVNNRVM